MMTLASDSSSPFGAGYVKGANFGTATQDNQFPQPIPGQNGGRMWRMAFGFRF